MEENKDVSRNLVPFSVRIDPEIRETVQALAWANQMSQRAILETALKDLFERIPNNIERSLKLYKD